MIKKILIANRGEIACRIVRTCRKLGIKTVAVFSEADRGSMHAMAADEAVEIGTGPASDSYLRMDRVIEAAKANGADAIHPGYGFLSERAEFVDACEEAGLTFIGPSSKSMRMLGGKIEAKTIAVGAGVPIAPGFFEPNATTEQLAEAAEKIGYPVMIKASAGGGGRGMRVVRSSADIREQLELASDEALKSFGDPAMMVEKLIERPKHIEVQFIADSHGNVACLFERECSLQRRHQKVMEEAPAPHMKEATWQAMRDATRRLVNAAQYVGAGTAEFMVDPVSGEFYFLEVNARLQVEHPVTEAITRLDLVQLQIAVANGEPLNLPESLMDGDRAAILGHAIELRIIAEDPANGFLPSVGKILGWSGPTGEGVRFDTGFGEGDTISPYYDSMIAKLIVHAPSRAEAIDKLIAAIKHTHILGVKTNLSYLISMLELESVRAGEMDTHLLSRELGDWAPSEAIPDELHALVSPQREAFATNQPAWDLSDGFRNVR